MSTQCGIAIKTTEGYETIYVHSDGYPAYMWPMLTKNYNSEELATKLVSLGDASYIDRLLEPTSDFHKFGTPEPDVSMFYHRDRGEPWSNCATTMYNTKKEMFNSFYYSYIWEDGQWKAYAGGRKVYFDEDTSVF
jgi:hypothetical protein